MSDNSPSSHPFAQKLQVLVAGCGYNFYDSKNRARADDLLIRQRSSDSLSSAAQSLTEAEADFKRLFIPAATRENPYPPAETMEKLRNIGRLRARIRDLETQIRGMPVPTQDKVWWRFREEQGLLNALLGFDYELVAQSEAIHIEVRALTSDDWNQGATIPDLTARLQQLDQVIRDRQKFLLLPSPY